MTIIREWANQVVFLTSILAGFSLSIAVQLISSHDKRRVVFASIMVFVVSAALLLATTSMASLILMRWELWQKTSLPPASLARIVHIRSLMSTMLMVGLLLFLAGLGLAGWIHSRAVGVISAITAAITALLIMWAVKAIP
jgi:hypothetical protein